MNLESTFSISHWLIQTKETWGMLFGQERLGMLLA